MRLTLTALAALACLIGYATRPDPAASAWQLEVAGQPVLTGCTMTETE